MSGREPRLSFALIEYRDKRILFDPGNNALSFAHNVKELAHGLENSSTPSIVRSSAPYRLGRPLGWMRMSLPDSAT
jgi:hypothetical protein